MNKIFIFIFIYFINSKKNWLIIKYNIYFNFGRQYLYYIYFHIVQIEFLVIPNNHNHRNPTKTRNTISNKSHVMNSFQRPSFFATTIRTQRKQNNSTTPKFKKPSNQKKKCITSEILWNTRRHAGSSQTASRRHVAAAREARSSLAETSASGPKLKTRDAPKWHAPHAPDLYKSNL